MIVNKRKIVKIPPLTDVKSILEWWSHEIDEVDPNNTEFEMTAISQEMQSILNLVLEAGGFISRGPLGSEPDDKNAFKTDLVVETIFADTETRPDKLEQLLGLQLDCLKSIARQNPVSSCRATYLIYCSVDKVTEYVSLCRRVVSLNKQYSAVVLIVVPYAHPAAGYAIPSNGHIDAVRLPNKVIVDRAKALEARGRRQKYWGSKSTADLYIKLAIDDDDKWLPWGVQEIVNIAQKADVSLGRKLKAIGVANQFVYYPINAGQVDLATWSLVLTGSKFFVSRSPEAIDDVTSWMLPESFGAPSVRNFRSRHIDLRVVKNTRPFFLYVRGFGNLSDMTKTEHYTGSAITQLGVGNHRDALEACKQLASRCEFAPLDEPSFEIDPPNLICYASWDANTLTLEVKGNFQEFLTSKGYDEGSQQSLQIVITSGDKVVLSEIRESVVVHVDGWHQRAILRIEDSDGDYIGSAWIRGSAPFLS